MRVRGFYRRQQSAFFEFRVSHPFARSYFNQSPDAFFESQSATRRREYLQRINDVDCGSFVPMIMSSTGAMGPEMSMAVKTLVRRLADKRKEAPSYVTGVVRAQFAFALARSALSLRGSRSRWSSGRSFAEVLEDPAEVVSRRAGIDRD